MEALALATLTLFANKIIELLKYIRAKDWNAAVTLLSVWLAGVAMMFVGASAVLSKGLVPPGQLLTLAQLDGWSKVLLGLSFTSTGSTLYDFKKALDNGDSAKQPTLTSLQTGTPIVTPKHETGTGAISTRTLVIIVVIVLIAAVLGLINL